jgi:signal transduction histidine kinase
LKKFLALALLIAIAAGLAVKPGMLASLLSANYLPHRYCYLAKPGLVWTNVSMDGLIAASYAAIFGCLMWVASKLRDLPSLRSYLWIFFAFGAFILACGATHAMEIVTIWWPVYPLSAAVKVICAAASVPTAILFAWATPALVANMRRYFEMLSTTRQEKEQAMRALIASERLAVAGLISATISHEIKAPLQSSTDLLYLLAHEERIPPDIAEKLAILTSELKRASAIANNTLSLFSKSSSLEPLLLSEVVESVLALQTPDLMRHKITLHSRLRTPVPLNAYAGDLRQMLINLIQNAAAAIGSGGRILIRVQPRCSLNAGASANRSQNGSSFHSTRPQPGYSITIADNGPGIEAKYRAQLFTLFFTTKGEKGTGLGLWLVRSMVEKEGGRIRFRSRTAAEASQTGTVFNIWVPLEPAHLALSSEADPLQSFGDTMELSTSV